MTTRTFRRLVPLWLWDGSEHAAEVEDFVELYYDAQDAGLDPVAGIETTPDGDVWTLSFTDDD